MSDDHSIPGDDNPFYGDGAPDDEIPPHGNDHGNDGSTRDDTTPHSPSRAALVERLSTYDPVLEVGIGRRPGVASALSSRGVDVSAVDVRHRPVPDGVRFVRDDIVSRAASVADDPDVQSVDSALASNPSPDDSVYHRAEAIYALNLPPELHRPTLAVARAANAAFLFTTLGGDPATVPATTESLGRETLYVARE